MNLWRKRNRNRRKPAGPRFEMPKIALPRAGRIAGAVAAIAALALLLAFGLDQPVRSIVIDGPFQRVSAVEVQQAAMGALKGGFVSANLDKLRSAVEALVWVDRARVQRVWPDRIGIEIVEQQASAIRRRSCRGSTVRQAPSGRWRSASSPCRTASARSGSRLPPCGSTRAAPGNSTSRLA